MKKIIIWVWILNGEIRYDKKKIGYDLDFFLFIWYYNYFVYFGFGMIMYYVIVDDKYVMIEYNCVFFDLK